MPLALVLGTKNQGKLVEIRRILSGLDLALLPITELPDAPDVIEDGVTYTENALKKACTFARWTGTLTLAEDSGLEVAALGGQPGVHTARFGGPGLSASERCVRLLARLQGVPEAERQAVFRCVAVLADPAGQTVLREGRCAGMIGHALQGDKGFGYDPIFLLPHLGRSMAQLCGTEKERVSHRAQAIRALVPLLTALGQGRPWGEVVEERRHG